MKWRRVMGRKENEKPAALYHFVAGCSPFLPFLFLPLPWCDSSALVLPSSSLYRAVASKCSSRKFYSNDHIPAFRIIQCNRFRADVHVAILPNERACRASIVNVFTYQMQSTRRQHRPVSYYWTHSQITNCRLVPVQSNHHTKSCPYLVIVRNEWDYGGLLCPDITCGTAAGRHSNALNLTL